MWILIWVLLTPGGDIMQHGVLSFESRSDCNVERIKIENQPMLLGQKIQAICLEKVK